MMKFSNNISIANKRARFDYEIIEEYEAGMVLYGTEIKALRSGKASITESFCQIKDGELYIINMHIDEYKLGTFYNHKIRRDRKLLLHKQELNKIHKKVKDVGIAIVPIRLFVNARGLAKILIGIGRGKKLYDKREASKERDAKRILDRVKKNF
jgi:SsrA-binding protein